jgi:hypothetical protein
VDPKAESDIEKVASMYSNAWHPVKIAPSLTVRISAVLALLILDFSISWCDQVTVTPEESSRIVFSKGTPMGLKGVTPYGGHLCPRSGVGEILLWKNPQKNDTKKNTSETMNKIIPVFRPFTTNLEWFPWVEDSRWMSRHQV